MPAQSVRVAAQDLRALATDILVAAGLTPNHARTITDAFIWANLRGIDAHGVVGLPRYLEMFEHEQANAHPSIDVQRIRHSTLLVDADRAPGPLALTVAMREAMPVARQTGVVWAAVRGTVHTGAIGYYTSMASAEGMAAIGIVAGAANTTSTSNGEAQSAGSVTTPFSIALPAQRHPDFLLDMATASLALGKITHAAGAGMSLALELLTSGISGNPLLSQFGAGANDDRQNATLVVVDVSAFLPVDDFRAIVDETIDAVTARPSMGDDAVPIPGARGAACYAERSRDGVPLPSEIWAALLDVAEGFDISVPEPMA